MEKSITISNKIFNMKSSSATQFAYKDFTGRSLLKDIASLTKYNDQKNLKCKNINEQIDILEKMQNILLKISFIMIKEYDKKSGQKQVIDYEEFLEQVDSLDDDCYTEILILACNPLHRQLQKTK